MVATTRKVDLTDVTEGGGSFRPRRKPEGDYKAKIVKVEDHQPKSQDSEDGWVYTIQIDGDARSTYPYYVNPAPKQKWKIGRICAAAGIQVAGKRIQFNPNKLVGKAIGVLLVDDEYEGRLKSSIDEVFPVSEVGANAGDDVDTIEDEEVEGDYEDDEPEPEPVKPTRRRKPAPEPEPEEDEDEEDEPAPPPTRRRKAAAPAPEPEDDEEDEEDEPAPLPRKRVAAKTAPVRRRKPAPVVEDDDLDDLDTDDLG